MVSSESEACVGLIGYILIYEDLICPMIVLTLLGTSVYGVYSFSLYLFLYTEKFFL